MGFGYDIHRLVAGRKLFLGGVEIPHPKGLKGHSDADVLLHAICDALLGALGKGDIGQHFPNTDDQYKGMSSLILLKKVHRLMKDQGFEISNIDSVVLAEAPNLTPFRSKMCETISHALNLQMSAVNIKATTQEGIGFGSTREAIAAYAIVLLHRLERHPIKISYDSGDYKADSID
jgi:2-C-methyl-D-erythritol 2,4-cyclodiphosphate synthase